MAKKKSDNVLDRLRAAIKRDGRTPYALSKVSGVSQAVLSRLLHGKNISVGNYAKLCHAVGLNLGE